MLPCLHQVFSRNQIYTLEEDGDACSILQRNFGRDGEKNFCKVYKPDKNGMKKRRNFEVGDTVIFKEQDCQRNQWPLARIIRVDTDRNGDVRSVTLCVADSHNGNQTLRGPITKGSHQNKSR